MRLCFKMAAIALLAVSGPALAQGSASRKTVLNVAIAVGDAGRMDPHVSGAGVDTVMFNWVFNGLVRFKPGDLNPENIEPDLAERWERSQDGLTWTFHLRRAVQCHHGYGEFTAKDVVYSLKRAADPARSGFSSDYKDFEGVEAIDDYTVRIKLRNPVPSLLSLVVNYHGGMVVCMKAAEELGPTFSSKPIGTGPFMLEEYKPKQSASLVANKAYFRGAPKLERIVYRFMPSDASRELAFTSGEIDLMHGKADQTWVERMRRNKDVAVEIFAPAELANLHFNMSKPPFNDIRVRQAVAHALDRDELARFGGELLTTPGKGVIPADNLGFSEVALPAHEPKKAKELLAAAGFPNGFNVSAIVSTLPQILRSMEVVQAQLKKSGINLDMSVVEHATYHAQIRKDLSQVTYYGAARFPIADYFLTQFFHSRSIVNTPTAVTNFSHCKVADAEIDAARTELDPEKAKELWKTAQRKIAAELCAVPMNETRQIWARRANLDLGYKLLGSLSNGPEVNETTTFR